MAPATAFLHRRDAGGHSLRNHHVYGNCLRGSVKATATATVTVAAPPPAGVAYVATSPTIWGGDPSIPASIFAYSVAANGRLTLAGTLALAANEQMAAVSGNSLFTIDPDNIHTYTIGSGGAVGSQTSEINTQNYGGAECGTTSGASFLDNTKNYLTVELYYNPGFAPCDAWQTYQISSSGQLTFVGDLANTGPQDFLQNGAQQLGISVVSGNNQFAYGISGGDEAQGFAALQRASAGELVWNSKFSEVDPAPDPAANSNFFPVNMTADSSNHLGVVMWEAFSPDHNSFLNMWVASYTIDNMTGAIQSTNTYANMPKLTVTNPKVMAISPSGTLLAVGSGGQGAPVPGLQLFHFNAADPVAPYNGVMLPNLSISQVAWDNQNHLYVLGDASGQFFLHVYTVTATTVTEAPGSPVTIPTLPN